ncbi:PQQ-dependent sugar dehydrogenase [Stakelama sp. CBK3Z-3]|uniref:PQQ-dependent sugar dehydrogenase n=1 Tax=Stakelama flava TaxID=2860338 RepID=A0ABS6XJ62_9SPHN|nr:PQQ-dependent sugar dehydrogenase [Stakelama flava]MBW4330254.1 PQQ-dependent sugar dehydrogenase [Stakelama flava]
MMRSKIAMGFLLATTACSGGNDDGGVVVPSPTPTPTNAAPVFSSSSAASIAENSNAVFYTAAASDPEGAAVTYSLVGGADEAQFEIASDGALRFISPPDFRDPTDADANNVYEVAIGASDGAGTTALQLNVTVTMGNDVPPPTLRASGFTEPVQVITDGDGRGDYDIVFERNGRVTRVYSPAGFPAPRETILDISSTISTEGEGGLLGAAVGEYAQVIVNGRPTTCHPFYLFVTNLDGDIEIRRYCPFADPSNRSLNTVLLRIPHRGSNVNYGGWIQLRDKQINHDVLYIGTGDGSSAGNPATVAQDPSSLLGKILRIDVGRDDFPDDPDRNYGIPAGNPFAQSGGAPEVWALGLRNPAQGSLGPYRDSSDLNGDGFVADHGEAREELNFVLNDRPGVNYGWPLFDGTRPYRGNDATGLMPPATEYAHGTGRREGAYVIPGVPYRYLENQFVFADAQTGAFWTIPTARFVPGQTVPSTDYILRRTDFIPYSGTLNGAVSFFQIYYGGLKILDRDGDLYEMPS